MSSPRIVLLSCLALSWVAAMGPPARADQPAAPAAPDPRLTAAAEASVRAEKLAQRKLAVEAQAEWARAAAGYAAVLAETHDDNLRLPLAVAEEGRGQLVAAAKELRALAKSRVVRPEVTAGGAARLSALLSRLGQLSLAVTPRRTAVRVGLATVAVTPLDESLVLAPGSYTFVLEANGYRSEELTLVIAAGQRLEREVALVSLASLAPPPPAASSPESLPQGAFDEPPSRLSPLVLAGVVTTSALVVAGVGTGLTALHRHSQYEDEPLQSRRDSYADSGRRWAVATDVLFGAALLTAAGTAYLYFTAAPRADASASPASSARSEARAPHRVHVVPWAGADSAGIGLAGAL